MTAFRAGVLVVAALLVTPLAWAADVPVVAGVRVAVPACPIAPLSVPAFVDSLRVELAGRTIVPGTTLVALAIEPCDTTTTRVSVAVTNDASGAGAARDVGLEDIAFEARPRALALAVAELVRRMPGATAPSPPPPAAAAAPSASEPPASTRGFAGDAVLELFPSRDTVLWGGRLSASIDEPRWSLALYGEAAAGAHGYEVGDVDLQSFGGGFVVGPLWSRGRLTLSPAFVGGLGWTRIQGHAGEPGVTTGAGSGLTAAIRARVAASVVVVRVVSVRAFLEGGWMARGLDATVDSARAAGLSGATLVVGLGLGL